MYNDDWIFKGYLIKVTKPTNIKVYVHKYEPIASYLDAQYNSYVLLSDLKGKFADHGGIPKFDLICYAQTHKLLHTIWVLNTIDINKVFGLTTLLAVCYFKRPLRESYRIFHKPTSEVLQKLANKPAILELINKYMDTHLNIVKNYYRNNNDESFIIRKYIYSIVGKLKGDDQINAINNDPIAKELVEIFTPNLLSNYELTRRATKEEKMKKRAENDMYLDLLQK